MDKLIFIIVILLSINTFTIGILLITLGRICKSLEYQDSVLESIYDQMIWFRNVM
jgi:hypothetical protein